MGHIFISYSHKDTDYAHRLADTLQAEGFDVWIDARLDYGSQWPNELQKQLDACDAFILIMTPRSFASEWVQNELQRAKRKLKPVFPLLLDGDEPWLSVESTQYYDVRGEKLPDLKFYSDLRDVASGHEGQAVQLPAEHVTEFFKPESSAGSPKRKTVIVIAITGAIATLLAAVILLVWSNRSQSGVIPGQTPDPSDFVDPKGVPMQEVPAGEFTMGSDNGDPDEKPVHAVYLDAYYIDKYEVTNARYKACADDGVCQPPQSTSSYTHPNYYDNSEFNDYPVLYVDWDMARVYCEWREAQLPTEAQWEKAARDAEGRIYPWGNSIDETFANYDSNIGDTTSVRNYEKGKSPYGVYDMAGNVWEWVADWYSASYDQSSPTENPLGPDSGQERVLRGGAWEQDEYTVRVTYRLKSLPSDVHFTYGFRCTRSVP